MTIDSVIELIKNIGLCCSPLITFLSAIGVVLYTQWSNRNIEKIKRNWEKSDSHRELVLRIKERRLTQIEEYLFSITEDEMELLGSVMELAQVKDEIEFCKLVEKFWNESDDNGPSKIAYYSIIQSLGDTELNQRLMEFDGVIYENWDLCNKYIGRDVTYQFLLQNKDNIKDELFEAREKYKNALTKFYSRLDEVFEESDMYTSSIS
jgi:hypothetical protein